MENLNDDKKIEKEENKVQVINIDLSDLDENQNSSGADGKKLEIVKGNSKDLNISKVQDSLAFEAEENPEETKENIVVPETKKD